MNLEDGIIQDQKGSTCQHCKRGVLGPLRKHPGRKQKEYRCGFYKCLKYTPAHANHLIYSTGDGNTHVPLRQQTATLFTIVHNSPLTLVHHLTSKSHEFIYKMSKSNDECRRLDVVAREKEITFGETPPGTRQLFDCEADEVDLAKEIDLDLELNPPLPKRSCHEDQNTVWEQWGGLIQRGNDKSLMLWRLNPVKTISKSPGP